MEGKRFGAGLAAGLLLGLALVAVSGGLGESPLAQLYAPRGAAGTTEASSTLVVTMSSTTSPTATTAATSTVTATTTYGGSTGPSLSSNESSSYASTSTATGGISYTITSTTNASLGNQSAATSASNGAGAAVTPSGVYRPSQLVNIPQQSIVSDAEILFPVLVAFLLGAFLYRVTTAEREKPEAEA